MKKYIKEHKKIFFIIVIFLSVLVLGTSFGRYVYNAIHNFILESQGFYFSSSVLSQNNSEYMINNWDGVNSYSITIDVNNKKNDLTSTNSDIDYDITLDCSDNVICNKTKDEGTIYKESKTDSYVITMTPKVAIKDGEIVTINTSVKSTSPYVKTLSGTYKIGIEKRGFSYSINDAVGDKFLTLELTNSISYYQVKEAFDLYSVGDKISLDVYKSLSGINQKKCFSADITLSFDPNILLLDMTNNNYLNRLTNSEKTQNINGYNYIKGFEFYELANSNQKIIFYKKDLTKDYTYPIINDTSIINVDVKTPN